MAVAGRLLDPLVHPDPWHPPPLYRTVLWLLRLLLRLLFRYRVEGLENVPAGPFIIAANHQAWYDVLFIVAAFPKRPMVYTMARRDTVFDRRWKRALVPRFGVFPIQPFQGELDQRGAQTVYQVLQRGGAVLLFPEGRYSRGKALLPLKKGVGHFALQAGVPICPVAVTGVDRLRLRGSVQVAIAPPVWPDPPGWWSLGRRVERVVDRVRRSIQHALDRERTSRPGRLRRLVAAAGARRRRRARPAPPPGQGPAGSGQAG